MELTRDELDDFIESWKRDFGEILPRETAHSEALRILAFFATLDSIANGTYMSELADEPRTP